MANDMISIPGYITLSEAEKFYGVKADTLKKQCLAGKYTGAIKQGKTWFVPEIPKTASHQDYLAVIYGYERIYGFNGGGIDRIAKEVSEYNLFDVIASLSKIALKLYSKGFLNTETQIQLIRDIFAADIGFRRKILDTIIREKSPVWVIFSEQSILSLLKIVLVNSQIKGGKPITPEDVGKVGHWLLLASDIWAGSDLEAPLVTPLSYEREKIREYLTREHFLMVRERLPYKLVRFDEILKRCIKSKRLDFEDIFLKASGGVSLNDFIYVCFMLIVRLVNIQTKEPDITKEWIVCRDKYFENIKSDGGEIDKTLSLLLLDIANYSKNYSEDLKNILNGEDFPAFNFLQFQKYPLIPINEKCFVTPSPHFLMDKVSEGTYWIIENYLRSTGLKKERDLLPVIWGDAFEDYIHECFTSVYKDQYIKNFTINDQEKFDGIINGHNVIFYIEDKYAHWSYKSKLIGKRRDMLPTLRQFFSGSKKVKGLGQITRSIKELEASKWKLPFSTDGKKYVPVIVVGEIMPMDAFSRKMYEDLAKVEGIFYENEKILPFIILDTEEV
jgi:hypothetical protein